jgi:hypothetical protein
MRDTKLDEGSIQTKRSFLDLMEMIFGVPVTEGTLESSNVLIEAVNYDETVIDKKPWKYSFYFSGEPYYTKHPEKYSIVLAYTKDYSKNFVPFPLYLLYTHIRPNHKEHYGFPPMLYPVIPPKKGVLVVISNDRAQVRKHCIDRMEAAGIPLYFGGKYRNNIGGPIEANHSSPEFYDIVAQYRCVLTMENSDLEYYITEKIFHGFSANTVPIYWGSKHVTEFFNETRFVNVVDPESNDWIQKIQQLMDDDAFYLKTIQESVYVSDPPNLTFDTVAKDCKRILRL